MPELDYDIVIIGAGPAGLSAAIAAERAGKKVVTLEAEAVPGGLTRSFERDGYTFDCSGHLLHLANDQALALVEEATPPDAWNRIARNSVISLGGRIIPYPFQLHLAYASEEVRLDCLENLPREAPQTTEFASFAEWISANLGDGIGRHFMVPYNEKLSTAKVGELTCDWLGRFVPQPSIEDIRRGGETKRTVETGYNRSFLYPARHGIATLSSGLAGLVGNLQTEARVAAIETGKRTVRCEDGREFGYREAVIATIPLPRLASMVTPGAAVLDEGRALRANCVTCVNLGLKSANPEFSQYQWIYLPEAEYAAYRVGFYSRFADSMAPPGRESVYVEIAHPPDADEDEVVAAAIADMVRLGAIESEDAVDVVFPVRIEYAYVIHDHAAGPIRAAIHAELAARDVVVAGRYANWEYSAMEDAIVDGLRAAERLTGVSLAASG
jgi:protoporphyrinogen oxidase